jgi:hypothetical protein
MRYFYAAHPFWGFFTTVWFHSAEVTLRDAALTNREQPPGVMDETLFEQVAAQKIGAAKIPLAAVCYRYDRADLIEPWSQLVDRFGCWHQLLNDLLGWHRDYSRQSYTYFLAEAERRRGDGEPVVNWVAREGFAWAVDQLQGWLLDLKELAAELHSPELVSYLETRETMLRKQTDEISVGLQNLAKLLD